MTYTISDLSAGLTYRLEMSAVYGNDTYSVRNQEPLIVNFDTSYTGNVHDYLVMYLDASEHKNGWRR